jgi:hypothetical protein
MKKGFLLLTLLIFSLCSLSAQEVKKVDFKYNGVYTAWGQFQNDFTLGRSNYEDHYFVQMFRLNLQFLYGKNLKAVTRFDLGQGWWGVDNVDNTGPNTATSNSGLFDNKDTHFLMHVDHAYLWFNLPNISTAFNVGRFNWSLGNKLVVDNNFDGIKANIKFKKGSLDLGFAKLSEGAGLSDFEEDVNSNLDANLLLISYKNKFGATNIEAYGAYYNDASIDDNAAYLIDGIDYNRPKFTPQVTSLAILGLAGKSKVGKLNFTYEANYLTGKDDITNATHEGINNVNGNVDAFKYDINNGDLSGYNIYLKADYTVSDAVAVGAVAGMGSGDDDPTDGDGNVNKLRTSGFFYLTEVWEDSIMPDEEGITPQGLGAPNVRAYRELENTTALQVNLTFKATKCLKLYTSFTYIKATQPVYAIVNGAPDLNTSATDLGMEVDFLANYKIMDKLNLIFRGGFFMPGTASQYLINGAEGNGTDTWDKSPWELKTVILFKF